MRTDRLTERHIRKLRATFRNLAKVPKSSSIRKMNKQLILHSEFVDKIDREVSVQYYYISFLVKVISLWEISCEIVYMKINKTIIKIYFLFKIRRY